MRRIIFVKELGKIAQNCLYLYVRKCQHTITNKLTPTFSSYCALLLTEIIYLLHETFLQLLFILIFHGCVLNYFSVSTFHICNMKSSFEFKLGNPTSLAPIQKYNLLYYFLFLKNTFYNCSTFCPTFLQKNIYHMKVNSSIDALVFFTKIWQIWANKLNPESKVYKVKTKKMDCREFCSIIALRVNSLFLIFSQWYNQNPIYLIWNFPVCFWNKKKLHYTTLICLHPFPI